MCCHTHNITIPVLEHPVPLLGGHHHPLCPGTLPWACVPRQELALGQGWGWHWGQLRCPGSHMPLSGLNFSLTASALFSAQLEKNPLELFLPLFPNLDGPKAPQADKGKFIASLCLWHCWNTLLPQIFHQGSVGKAQCPQQGLTLTYICPSLFTATPGTLAPLLCLGPTVAPLAVPGPPGTAAALSSCSELCLCPGSCHGLAESQCQVPHGFHGFTHACCAHREFRAAPKGP